MNKRTHRALQESILKWGLIAKGEMPDLGSDNCSLCSEFLDLEAATCGGCPVAEATGLVGCQNTPYVAWLAEMEKRHPEGWEDEDAVADTPKLVKLALAERDFLRSLVPMKRRAR